MNFLKGRISIFYYPSVFSAFLMLAQWTSAPSTPAPARTKEKRRNQGDKNENFLRKHPVMNTHLLFRDTAMSNILLVPAIHCTVLFQHLRGQICQVKMLKLRHKMRQLLEMLENCANLAQNSVLLHFYTTMF